MSKETLVALHDAARKAEFDCDDALELVVHTSSGSGTVQTPWEFWPYLLRKAREASAEARNSEAGH